MSKIIRYSGNVRAFAADALGTERTVFGGITQSDVLDDNIIADLLRGWGIVGVNENPTKQDFNAMGFTLGQLIAYLHQVGVPEWHASQEYHTYSVANYLGTLYFSTVDNNIGNTPGTDANWRLIPGSSISYDNTASGLVAEDMNSAVDELKSLTETTIRVIEDFSSTAGSKQNSSDDIGSLTFTESRDSPVIDVSNSDSRNDQYYDTGGSMMFLDGRWWYWHSGRATVGNVDSIVLHISSGSEITTWGLAAETILAPGGVGTYDEGGVVNPCVILHGGLFRMWYTAIDGSAVQRIAYATSPDGITWTKHGTTVLDVGGVGAWDEQSVAHPSVVHNGTEYVMAYRGWAVGDADIQSQIGIATSTDGTTWTRYGSNPVLAHGGVGSYDETGLLAPRMWIEDHKYYMNYSGKPLTGVPPENSSVCHAYAGTDYTSWTKSAANPILDAATTSYSELEWGNMVRINNVWHLFSPAFFDGGVTTLWIGI